MKKYDVITMGSATIDHFATINKPFSKIKQGDKILVTNQEIQIGGGAINSAIALKKLGIKTAFLGKVGNDHNGELILKELKKNKIKIIKTSKSKHSTSYSYIIQEKDRIVFTHKGASNDLTETPKLKTKWIYLATLMGKSWNTSKKILKNTNAKILFNPSNYLAKKGKKYLSPILKRTELLILNKKEAQLLLNKKDSIKNMLKDLQKLGPKKVIITEGKKGVHAINKCIYKVKPFKVKSKSNLGAGDAFSSAVLATLIQNKPFETALINGNANAASVIQQTGAQKGLLTKKQITKYEKQTKKYVKKIKC